MMALMGISLFNNVMINKLYYIFGAATLLGASWLATGCSAHGFSSVKQDSKFFQTAAASATKLKVTKEFDPAIAGDSYIIPDIDTETPQKVSDDTKKLPARTSDGTNISILPPGANI